MFACLSSSHIAAWPIVVNLADDLRPDSCPFTLSRRDPCKLGVIDSTRSHELSGLLSQHRPGLLVSSHAHLVGYGLVQVCLESHEDLGLGYVPLGELGHGHAACSDGQEHSAIAALDRFDFASGVVEVGHGVFRRDVDDHLHLGDISEGDSTQLLRLLLFGLFDLFDDKSGGVGGGRGAWWRSDVPAARGKVDDKIRHL